MVKRDSISQAICLAKIQHATTLVFLVYWQSVVYRYSGVHFAAYTFNGNKFTNFAH
ncbi:hypothetical protein QE197_05010 [Arsenophonus nasoniae]|uniref:Uncharacterized protein n=1 Tax=Arsenophonus nasoniae TaxID=638 RepID=D2U0E4_9GAMM|nr:hypothetical protein [Arsenophonus nasoniae]WGM06747.1 hypothetical protein QE258_05455 [Arsenophonus nasoniae]WGM11697.1 hypothetical protein QE197_05010 [Arsenophonus nasoniae]WGM16386.1 hypothetical protein QE193_04965 [Arsenophonus nasoniae]CBA73778.1 hypothetical protein ARN_19620 [Arsenophonus nasoniae]